MSALMKAVVAACLALFLGSWTVRLEGFNEALLATL